MPDSTAPHVIEGRCFCGRIRYAIDAGVYPSANCHCTMCRHAERIDVAVCTLDAPEAFRPTVDVFADTRRCARPEHSLEPATTAIRGRIAAALGLAVAAGVTLFSAPGASHAQTSVRDVDSPARQPFNATVLDRLIPIDRNRSIAVAKVPPGKRLVIEHVSFAAFGQCNQPAQTPAAASVLASLETDASVDGTVQPQAHQLRVDKIVVSPPSCPIGNAFVASQPIRVYVESGHQVSVTFDAFSERDRLSITRVAISGHLIDAP
jgi:hypothetical protein